MIWRGWTSKYQHPVINNHPAGAGCIVPWLPSWPNTVCQALRPPALPGRTKFSLWQPIYRSRRYIFGYVYIIYIICIFIYIYTPWGWDGWKPKMTWVCFGSSCSWLFLGAIIQNQDLALEPLLGFSLPVLCDVPWKPWNSRSRPERNASYYHQL